MIIAWHGLAFPPALAITLSIARTVAATLLLFGVRPRAAGLLTAALACAVQTQDPFGTFYTIQLLYLAIATVALAEPEDAGLVRALLASVYIWSALAKCHHDWLDGHVLAMLARSGQVRALVFRDALGHPAFRLAIAWATPITEAALGLAMALGRRRVLAVAVITAALFHAMIEWMLNPDVIGFVMAALLLSAWPWSNRPDQRASGAPSDSSTA